MKQQPDINVVIRYLEEPGHEEHKRSLDEWLQLDAANLDIFLETKALWQGDDLIPSAATYNTTQQWQRFETLLATDEILGNNSLTVNGILNANSGLANAMTNSTANNENSMATTPNTGMANNSNSTNTTSTSSPVIRMRKPIHRYWWAAAASVLLMAGTFLLVRQPLYTTQQTAQNKDSLLLPDGTRLYLNAHTSVKYPRRFKGDTREVYVQQGEVFVDVKHMPEKPFTVHLKNVDIEVLGTSFDVKETKQGVKVFVQSGKVRAIYKNKHKSVILTPGQEADMLLASEYITTRIHRNNNPIAWKTGQLTFDDTPLSEVADILGDYYKVRFVLKGEQVADKKLIATFHKESLSEVLDILSKTLQVHTTQKDSIVEIY